MFTSYRSTIKSNTVWLTCRIKSSQSLVSVFSSSTKMNIFRLAGDMTHLASVLVLLLKIHTIKSCSGTFSLSLTQWHFLFYFIFQLPIIWLRCVHFICRRFIEDSRALRSGFRHPILGYIHRFCVSVQYSNEAYILG